jgi:hypothetical protein
MRWSIFKRSRKPVLTRSAIQASPGSVPLQLLQVSTSVTQILTTSRAREQQIRATHLLRRDAYWANETRKRL